MLTVLYNVSQKGRPTHAKRIANALSLANAVPWRLTHRDNFPARQLAGTTPVAGGTSRQRLLLLPPGRYG